MINKVKYNFEDGEDVLLNKIWVKGEYCVSFV